MIDATKYADAVKFVIDVSYGYEMETLEFVNLLKVHGMHMVMGVFTHLDCFKNQKDNDEIRTAHFKKDFWNEIYEGAQTLTRCIWSMIFANWRTAYWIWNSILCHGELHILMCW